MSRLPTPYSKFHNNTRYQTRSQTRHRPRADGRTFNAAVVQEIDAVLTDLRSAPKDDLRHEQLAEIITQADRGDGLSAGVDLSLERDFDVSSDGGSLLHAAVSVGSLPVVKSLLACKNASLWLQDLRCWDRHWQKTPFAIACRKDTNAKIVQEFLKDRRLTTESFKLRPEYPMMSEAYQELFFCHPKLLPILADPTHGKCDVNQRIGGMGILHRLIRDFQDRSGIFCFQCLSFYKLHMIIVVFFKHDHDSFLNKNRHGCK